MFYYDKIYIAERQHICFYVVYLHIINHSPYEEQDWQFSELYFSDSSVFW